VWGQPAASDNRFVTVDGDDEMADVFIGRLPVNTAAEATTVVDKILSYELNPPRWPWNERVLFFAGHEPDAPYHGYSDEVYHEHLPGGFTGRRVYFCTSNCDQPHEYDDITAAHDALMRELNAGGLLASYVGHSSIHQWDWDPATWAPLFHVDDVASLHNGGALPLFVQMTCVTSYFSYPTDDTLDGHHRAGAGHRGCQSLPAGPSVIHARHARPVGRPRDGLEPEHRAMGRLGVPAARAAGRLVGSTTEQ
jgi:hypothetical protein